MVSAKAVVGGARMEQMVESGGKERLLAMDNVIRDNSGGREHRLAGVCGEALIDF